MNCYKKSKGEWLPARSSDHGPQGLERQAQRDITMKQAISCMLVLVILGLKMLVATSTVKRPSTKMLRRISGCNTGNNIQLKPSTLTFLAQNNLYSKVCSSRSSFPSFHCILMYPTVSPFHCVHTKTQGTIPENPEYSFPNLPPSAEYLPSPPTLRMAITQRVRINPSFPVSCRWRC